jgi:glycosyltransferase involved in cell wall biosynthesis
VKILVAMIEPPDPTGNASARWYFTFLSSLLERGHSITALATVSKPLESYSLGPCREWKKFTLHTFPVPTKKSWWQKISHLFFPFRGHFSADFHSRMAAEIESGYDIIHLEQTWCGWLALRSPKNSVLNVHYLRKIDTANMPESGLLPRLNHLLAVRAERYLIRRYPNIRVLSSRLDNEIKKFHPRGKISEVSFGMDVSSYERLTPAAKVPTIGIMGNMEWYPSFSSTKILLEEIWPRVKLALPNSRALVFGWSAGKKFSSFSADPRVEILESVPSVPPALARMDVFVCANFGATGTKTKIIEAMLYGIPVVTTMEGLEGLPAVPGVHAEVADGFDGLSAKTVDLLLNPRRRQEMASAARELIQGHCSPARTVDQLESLYREIRAAKV